MTILLMPPPRPTESPPAPRRGNWRTRRPKRPLLTPCRSRSPREVSRGLLCLSALGQWRPPPPMTPFCTALVTASASACVSFPSVTAWSSRVFNPAASSACRSVRSSAKAAVTLDSSIPRDPAKDFARAASRVAWSGFWPSAGGVVGLFASRNAWSASVTLASSTPSFSASAEACATPRSPPRPPCLPMPPGAVLVLPSAEALELALGEGVGVVVAEAMPATPIPAPRASAAADKPRVIFFVRDILCLLDLPFGDGCW
ncbi:hypothetical protein ARTHRO9AX_80471 [Arthrobacter sp. 9AX]|nr:hypothetical protein ARTHRO9AX_80471 [Arthrobacter sp. 9AX]